MAEKIEAFTESYVGLALPDMVTSFSSTQKMTGRRHRP
jgi:hypothetical protein